MRLKEVLNLLDLLQEKFEYHAGSFSANMIHDGLSLGKSIEVFEQFNCISHGRNLLNRERDDVVDRRLKLLALIFEQLAIMIMPLSLLDIKNVIVEGSNLHQILVELLLLIQQLISVSRALDTTEDRHLLVLALSCELELALADLVQLSASLNEGVVLSEDSLVLIKIPAIL